MRQISASLWIGNAVDARNRASIPALGIEAIVDLAGEETPVEVSRDLIYCRLPLVDGSGNCPARIDLAIETIRQLIKARVPTLVACSAGLSRSPLLTAADRCCFGQKS